ncbi:MAG: hypothetical protein SU899_03130 [Chloroflexota bacterium]|nr:hypothetical protein [Chloroflexota bacterium]
MQTSLFDMSKRASKAVAKRKLLILTLAGMIILVLLTQGCTCGCVAREWWPAVTNDNSGGAIVTYGIYEGRDRNAYVQRVDAEGNKLWGEKGVLLASASPPNWLRRPHMIADGSGGAIIVWKQSDGVFGQKVDSGGQVLWQEGGSPVFSGFKAYQGVVSDGLGGALIATSSYSKEKKEYLLQIRRIDSAGNLLWTKDNTLICLEADAQSGRFHMASDNSGGAIIVWKRRLGGIFAQRIDNDGNVLWGAGGLELSLTPNTFSPEVTGDGSGGAIVVWEHVEKNEEGQQLRSICAQRIDAEGDILWRQGGLPICSSSELLMGYPRIISDGSGGAVFTWMTYNDIYAQRINSDGDIQWSKDGVKVQGSEAPQASHCVIADGSGGAIVAFERISGSIRDPAGLCYVQKLDAMGKNQWQPDGTLISTKKGCPIISDDGFGGAVIVCWPYAQKINAEGERVWGEKGILLSRKDVF